MSKNNPYDHSLKARGLRAVSTILSDHAEQGKVYISLAQFRQDILPYLANPENRDLSYWLSYVKHPNAALYVLDEDESVKYVVPPISSSISTGIPKVGTHAMDGQIDMMRKRIERSPRSSDKEFAQTLSPHIRHEENILTNRIRLNQILVAEGYTPLHIPGTRPGFTGVDSTLTTTAAGATTKTGYLDEFEDSDL